MPSPAGLKTNAPACEEKKKITVAIKVYSTEIDKPAKPLKGNCFICDTVSKVDGASR